MNFVLRMSAFAFVALSSAVSAAPLPRSVSTSRQFIVYGPDARLRGGVCDLAERLKKTALTILREQDNWKTPIVIAAERSQANLPELPSAQLNLGQTGFGLKLQLDLRLAADVDAPAIERELLRSIFLEMMYRAEPDVAAGTAYVQPPDWLLEGTLALSEGHDPAGVAETLGTAVSSNNVISLEDFLRQRPTLLDAPSQNLYRAYATALIAMLSDTPDDRRRLARFVGDLSHAGNDPAAVLKTHFPALGQTNEESQKIWTQHLTQFAARERYRLLGCDESERQLAPLLQVEVRGKAPAPVVYALEEFPRFIRDPNSGEALHALTQQLLALSGRVHPLYRPVVMEYQQIVTLLSRKKTKRITERLASAREIREHIRRRMSAIGDYLNWYEATQSRSASGAFREYMKAAELAVEREPRRHDPLSVYLDSLEAQLEN